MQGKHSNPDVVSLPDNDSMIRDAVVLVDFNFEELAIDEPI